MLAFGVRKFRSMLLAGTFAVLACFLMQLTDSLLAGNLLGAEALAGVNLASPFQTIIAFFAGMLATGTGTRYALAMGRCDILGARRIFTQGLWSVLIVCGALSAALLLFSDELLAFYGATGDAFDLARIYLFRMWPIGLLHGLLALLIQLSYSDGDSRLCVIAYGAVFAVNLLLSYALLRLGFGIAACAYGTVAADLVGGAIMLLHFRSPSNTYRAVKYFSPKETLAICGASLGDSASLLCNSLLALFINAFAVREFGEGVLPVTAVAMTAWCGLFVFDGVGAAIQPIVTVYAGEDNPVAIRKVMKAAMSVSAVEGLLASAVFLVFAPAIVSAIGVSDVELAAEAVIAVRCLAIGIVPFAFAGLFNSYYMFIDRPFLAGLLTVVVYLVLPVAMIAVFTLFADASGLWLGLGSGTLLGVALVGGMIALLAGKAAFPLLLDRKRETELTVFDLALDESSIVDTSRRIGELPGMPMKASLLTEEVLMTVKDRSAGKRINAEVTVDSRDGFKLTFRDDGAIFDITDADQSIRSLRSYLVASMMIHHDGKLNLVTTGFNRNVFHFPKEST